jgi:xylulokinase
VPAAERALYVGHDVGTGGNKAVLLDAAGGVIARATAAYALHRPAPGWAEQDPEDWWRAVAETTRRLLADSGRDPRDVRAIAFAGQMLALAPLNASGAPTRRAISWLDARAHDEARAIARRIGGSRVVSLVAGAAPTGKDIVAKVAWLAKNEPAVHARTAAYCDATGFLVARATGKLRIDPTAVGGTGLYDARTGGVSRPLAWLAGYPRDKVPEVAPATSIVGPLLPAAAAELGLPVETQVAMGLADVPAAAVGSGAMGCGDAHVYIGTSSWIGVTCARAKNVPRAGIASVPAASAGRYLMIGESETAGACRAWVSGALGDGDLEALVGEAPPGCEGLLFLPWLYGERSPIPDAHLRGGYVGLSLQHGRPHLARAVYEGTAFNLRWILDEMEGAGEPCPSLRAIGGGARSDEWLQILADVTGRPIARVSGPEQAGAVGAALVAAVAAGEFPSLEAAALVVRPEREFVPRRAGRRTYDAAYATFRALARPLSRATRRGAASAWP